MADADPLEALRLSLMQDVLPVGIAMIERARKGGVRKVAEVFNVSEKPFTELRDEGEFTASTIRDQLDKVSPGLGNPVVSVKVAVNEEETICDERLSEERISDDPLTKESLMNCLVSIESRLQELEEYLSETSVDISTSSLD